MLVVIAFIIAKIIDLNGVSLVSSYVTDVIMTSCFACSTSAVMGS